MKSIARIIMLTVLGSLLLTEAVAVIGYEDFRVAVVLTFLAFDLLIAMALFWSSKAAWLVAGLLLLIDIAGILFSLGVYGWTPLAWVFYTPHLLLTTMTGRDAGIFSLAFNWLCYTIIGFLLGMGVNLYDAPGTRAVK